MMMMSRVRSLATSRAVRRAFASAASQGSGSKPAPVHNGKKTTGLVGLAVNANAHTDLIALYQTTLNAVKVIPEEAEYRKAVEKITKYRLSVVEGNSSIADIEATINSGQIEELIKQANDELALIPKMSEWKPWEPLAVQPPTGQWEQQ